MPRAILKALGTLLLVVGVLATLAIAAGAQVPEGWWGGRFQRELVPAERAGFMFCRLVYNSGRGGWSGRGWDTDYPMSDRNLMLRLGDFTTTEVNLYEDGEPAHAVVRATDPELFTCPFLFGSDMGSASLGPDEVDALREYLLKGGFLWVDDFWGRRALQSWLGELRKILPEQEPVRLPPDHPLLSSYYFLDAVPQIPGIGFWRRSRGETSERGAESAVPTLTGIFDDSGRLMVLMSHNTDIANGWERETDDYAYFYRFSPLAYAVGINVAVYSMTR